MAVKIRKPARTTDVIIPASKFILRLLAAMLAAFAIVLAAVAWRLSSGPLSLGFLSPYLKDALTYGETGLSADVQDTVLTWGGFDHTLEIRAIGVRLIRKDGRLLASIPQISVRFSAKALLRARLAPTSFEVIGGKALITRNEDGHFDIGLADQGGSDNTDVVSLVVDELSRTDNSGIAAYLTRVALVDAELTITDRKLGAVWQVPRATVVLWREAGGVRAEASLNVRLGDRLTKLSAAGHYTLAQQSASVRIAFVNLEPALFADVAPAFAALKAVRLPLSGAVGFTAAADGHMSGTTFDLVGGNGTLDLRPQVDMAPLALHAFAAKGHFADDFAGVTLDLLQFDLSDARGEASGTIDLPPGGVGLDLAASINGFPTAALERYWPADVAKHARDWVLTNIKGGTVSDVKLKAKLSPAMVASGDIPADALALDFRFSGLSAIYLSPLPSLDGVSGSARLTGKTFDLQADAGHVGDLQVSEGKVGITDLDKSDQIATISLVVSGPAGSALGLLDHKPFGFVSRLGVDATKVSGLSAIRARFAFPLRHDFPVSQLQVVAAANLRDIAIPDVFNRYALTAGDLALRVDKQRMEVNGTLAVQGVPTQITWQEEFDPAPGQAQSRYKIGATVDDAGRKALGYPMDPYVTGPVKTDLTIETSHGSDTRVAAHLDLQPAKVEISELHWTKPAGPAGSLDLSVIAPPKGPVRIADIALKSETFSAQADATVADGVLTQLTVPHVIFDKNDFTAAMKRDADGTMHVEVEGKSFDFRPYLDDIFAPETKSDKSSPPLDLAVHFDGLILADGEVLQGFAGTGRRREDLWRDLDATGRLNGTAAVALHLAPDGARRKLSATADDAGQVVKSIGISDDTVGGKFDLTGEIADDQADQPIRGRLRIDNFKVVRAPIMARLLTVASLTGIVDTLSGDGINFVRADVPFHTRGGKLHIDNARAWGAALGITATGSIERGHDGVNLNGTIVPAYTINRILGAIPLIGSIIVGREGEGIIGITYSVSGNTDNPQVSVNPLSAIAPGFLRRIFEPSTTADTSDLPPSADAPADPPAPASPAK